MSNNLNKKYFKRIKDAQNLYNCYSKGFEFPLWSINTITQFEKIDTIVYYPKKI